MPGTSHQKINKRAKRTYLSIQESKENKKKPSILNKKRENANTFTFLFQKTQIDFQTKNISLFYKNKE